MTSWNITTTKEFLSDFQNLPSNVTQHAFHTTLRMLQDPWATELHPEKVKSAESGVHSSRVDDNYRLIWKHIKPNDILFLMVDKHDEAYRRASRKSFTLVDGVVKIADIIEVGAKPAQALDFTPDHKPGEKIGKLFAGYYDKDIISWGIPPELLPHIRVLDDANELAKFEYNSEISGPVFDKLLSIALDLVERPTVPDEKLLDSLERNQGGEDIYRFIDTDEFKRVLEGGMEEWMLFLAPFQRALTVREYNGPSRVRGVAGSGKTVIALHRARFLARKLRGSEKKVLFLTYGNRLPGVMKHLFGKLVGADGCEIQSFECITIHQLCQRLLKSTGYQPKVDDTTAENLLVQAITSTKSTIHIQALFDRPLQFFQDEIKYAIKGRCVSSLAQYLKLDRSGRGTALNPKERAAMYTVYEAYQKGLNEAGICDWDDFILDAIKVFDQGKFGQLPYSHVIVDEIQDLTESTMRLIRQLVPQDKNDLFLVGDGMQRIYAGGYALANLGIDVVGRSSLLYKNYRNTQQVLRAAHSVIKDVVLDDMEVGEGESVEPEYSVRQGENPLLKGFLSSNAELQWVTQEIDRLIKDLHYKKGDIAILFRHILPYRDNILSTLKSFSLPSTEITKDPLSYFGDTIKLTTFHSAKGLEFKVVFVVGVTDGQFVPRDDWTREGEDLIEYLENEKRLLYVAMTRARDLLYMTYSRGQPSRFLAQVPKEYLRQ